MLVCRTAETFQHLCLTILLLTKQNLFITMKLSRRFDSVLILSLLTPTACKSAHNSSHNPLSSEHLIQGVQSTDSSQSNYLVWWMYENVYAVFFFTPQNENWHPFWYPRYWSNNDLNNRQTEILPLLYWRVNKSTARILRWEYSIMLLGVLKSMTKLRPVQAITDC